jgi:hypothetical protein
MKIHFAAAELIDRRAVTITNLEHEGLDGLLMFRQESRYYQTGAALVTASHGDISLETFDKSCQVAGA